jgi:DNA-binding NtrC family response regulator
MPPPAAAAIPAPMAAVGAPAPVGIDSVATVAESARASSGNGNGNVSLKDISRSAAREAERELILRMLTKTRWNRKEAAEILGISYKALLYKIKENGLDKAS